jgi:hypothetical protein
MFVGPTTTRILSQRLPGDKALPPAHLSSCAFVQLGKSGEAAMLADAARTGRSGGVETVRWDDGTAGTDGENAGNKRTMQNSDHSTTKTIIP